MIIHRVSKLIMCTVLTVGMTWSVPAAVAAPAYPGDSQGGAYLGVMVDSVSPETAASLHLKNGGASITNVDQDGPACRAGLKGGDIVVAYNGKPVTGSEQFASLIHGSAPSSTVMLTVIRGGQSKDIKVTLGDWKQMAGMTKGPMSPAGNTMFPVPPMPRVYPDIDIPGGPSISARHGIVVEPLSTQLGEFFGAPQNQGVLVRSVEKGSPGAAAGLRAGDVIVRVNNETIHDTADWRRALKGHGGKVVLSIVRDKKEMTLQMSLPGDTSELKQQDWDALGQEMQSLAAEMQKLQPEFEQNAKDMATLAQLSPEQMDEIHRQAESAAKTITPEMKQQAEEISKQTAEMRQQAENAAKTMTPEMKKQAEELRKQAVEMQKQTAQLRKDLEKMTPKIARNAREMAEAMKPGAKELSDMAGDIEQQWKEMQPEFQQQMEQLKKQLEQEKREWQEMLKNNGSKQQF